MVKANSINSFLKKTHDMVSERASDHIIHWSESGLEFVIEDVDRLSREILPHFFKHNHYASFVRQLNMYGFHKSGGSNKSATYNHVYFQRGNIELCRQIVRKTNMHNDVAGSGDDNDDDDDTDENGHHRDGDHDGTRRRTSSAASSRRRRTNSSSRRSARPLISAGPMSSSRPVRAAVVAHKPYTYPSSSSSSEDDHDDHDHDDDDHDHDEVGDSDDQGSGEEEMEGEDDEDGGSTSTQSSSSDSGLDHHDQQQRHNFTGRILNYAGTHGTVNGLNGALPSSSSLSSVVASGSGPTHMVVTNGPSPATSGGGGGGSGSGSGGGEGGEGGGLTSGGPEATIRALMARLEAQNEEAVGTVDALSRTLANLASGVRATVGSDTPLYHLATQALQSLEAVPPSLKRRRLNSGGHVAVSLPTYLAADDEARRSRGASSMLGIRSSPPPHPPVAGASSSLTLSSSSSAAAAAGGGGGGGGGAAGGLAAWNMAANSDVSSSHPSKLVNSNGSHPSGGPGAPRSRSSGGPATTLASGLTKSPFDPPTPFVGAQSLLVVGPASFDASNGSGNEWVSSIFE